MEDLKQYYQKGKWKGIDCWQCLLCPHSTTSSEEDILKHIQGHIQAPQVTRRKPLIPVYTKSGQPLDLEIEEIVIQEEPNGD